MKETFGDLHIHTGGVCFDIPKVTYSLREAIAKAAERECRVVAITEHEVLHPYDKTQEIARRSGIILIPAVEVRGLIEEGWRARVITRLFGSSYSFVDILAYGITEPIPGRSLPLAKVVEIIHKQNGLAIVAHPSFNVAGDWYGPEGRALISGLGIDGIEVFNGRSLPRWNRRAVNLAAELSLAVTGGSDAHRLQNIGIGLTFFRQDLDAKDWCQCIEEIRNKRTTVSGQRIKLWPFFI